MYAKIDKNTQEFYIELPEDLKPYFQDLQNDLTDEFSFDLLTKDTLKRINLYIKEWFNTKGIELHEGKNE